MEENFGALEQKEKEKRKDVKDGVKEAFFTQET